MFWPVHINNKSTSKLLLLLASNYSVPYVAKWALHEEPERSPISRLRRRASPNPIARSKDAHTSITRLWSAAPQAWIVSSPFPGRLLVWLDLGLMCVRRKAGGACLLQRKWGIERADSLSAAIVLVTVTLCVLDVEDWSVATVTSWFAMSNSVDTLQFRSLINWMIKITLIIVKVVAHFI